MAQDLEKFEGTPCLNCGCDLTGPFCAQCGQRATDVNLSVRTLVVEFAESLFSWELGFWQTFKRLVFLPGSLSAEYIVGRRKRYSSPIKLYLGTSLIFFFIMSVLPGVGDQTSIQVGDDDGGTRVLTGPEAMQALKEGFRDSMEDSTAAAQADSALQEVVGRVPAADNLERALEDPDNLKKTFFSYLPRAMFLMVPLSALLLQLVYFRHKRPYLHYLVFSLHMHALFYFTTSVALLVGRIPPEWLGDSLAMILLLSIPVNCVRAQRRVFRDGWFKAFLKAGLVWHVYLFFLSLVMAGVAVLMVFLA